MLHSTLGGLDIAFHNRSPTLLINRLSNTFVERNSKGIIPVVWEIIRRAFLLIILHIKNSICGAGAPPGNGYTFTRHICIKAEVVWSVTKVERSSVPLSGVVPLSGKSL
jgi:hypothetical protein